MSEKEIRNQNLATNILLIALFFLSISIVSLGFATYRTKSLDAVLMIEPFSNSIETVSMWIAVSGMILFILTGTIGYFIHNKLQK